MCTILSPPPTPKNQGQTLEDQKLAKIRLPLTSEDLQKVLHVTIKSGNPPELVNVLQ